MPLRLPVAFGTPRQYSAFELNCHPLIYCSTIPLHYWQCLTGMCLQSIPCVTSPPKMQHKITCKWCERMKISIKMKNLFSLRQNRVRFVFTQSATMQKYCAAEPSHQLRHHHHHGDLVHDTRGIAGGADDGGRRIACHQYYCSYNHKSFNFNIIQYFIDAS